MARTRKKRRHVKRRARRRKSYRSVRAARIRKMRRLGYRYVKTGGSHGRGRFVRTKKYRRPTERQRAAVAARFAAFAPLGERLRAGGFETVDYSPSESAAWDRHLKSFPLGSPAWQREWARFRRGERL